MDASEQTFDRAFVTPTITMFVMQRLELTALVNETDAGSAFQLLPPEIAA